MVTEKENIYITETSKSAKEKIGKKLYYCSYTGFMFTEDELKDCSDSDKHKNANKCCILGCDRKNMQFFTKHHLRGEHLKPSMSDPVIEVQFNELPEHLKIKRTIIDYDD